MLDGSFREVKDIFPSVSSSQGQLNISKAHLRREGSGGKSSHQNIDEDDFNCMQMRNSIAEKTINDRTNDLKASVKKFRDRE